MAPTAPMAPTLPGPAESAVPTETERTTLRWTLRVLLGEASLLALLVPCWLAHEVVDTLHDCSMHGMSWHVLACCSFVFLLQGSTRAGEIV